MISTNDFRPGVHIELEGELYTVIEAQHVKRGRGSAYVWAKIKNLRTGAIVERTFNAGERVPQAILERREMQYLYSTGEEYVFMDQESYEQVGIPVDVLGETAHYLVENMVVGVYFYEGRPIEVELPTAVELEVVDTAPGVRGDTVSGGTKPATLQTGLVVQVPLFVQVGDRIRVDTRTGEYLERVK
ncbi:MAG: elongation factor P [Armatimonadota bacterium]|nr:elongation factor P [Armatimonadota bacterium]MDR5703111.1 elongation factor P [Armatimonadota bacterium]